MKSYFKYTQLEFDAPVPNMKRAYDSKAKSTRPYDWDVFCETPRMHTRDLVPFQKIGIEIDGAVGHKKTENQYMHDEVRTTLLKSYYKVNTIRFDTDELVGKGYVNPKTKKITSPILTNKEILERLGITPLPEHLLN